MSAPVNRFLLVDDARVEFLWLQRMLQQIFPAGHVLDWTAAAAAALAAIGADRHDLYFVDYRLGPENGLDLIRAVRQRGVMKPIIMLTAHGDLAADQAATAAGANDYLVKGEFDRVLLERAIRYATRNAQAVAGRAAAEAELFEVLRSTVNQQEEDRRRIARELHDSLGQSLTLLQLGLDALSRHRDAGAAIVEQLACLQKTAAATSVQLNRLACDIRPTVLDDLGLQPALSHLAAEWEKHCGLTFDLLFRLGDRRLPSEVETTLYRIVQEAVTNVVKHAGARRVEIIVESTEAEVRCIIEDDGIGMKPQAPPRRFGLLGMRERLALVNGTLEIESVAGRGTTVFARVPL